MGGVTGRNIVLTGVPRAGTTLACKLLGACVETVALFEPMDVNALPAGDRGAAIAAIDGFFATIRTGVQQDGLAPSKQVGGTLPDNLFAASRDSDGNRQMLATPGFIALQPPPSAGFTLVIKQNAAFTALLPELAATFQTLAIIRHPLSVLASWNSVDLPVSHGRLPAGEQFDPELASQLDAEPRLLARQLRVLEWFFSRFDRFLLDSQVLRYEDIIESDGALLRARAGVSGDLVPGLAGRNANPAYDATVVQRAADALVIQGGSWQRWYPKEKLSAAAHRIIGRRSLP